MSLYGFVGVGVGAMCGAWLRWMLGLALNPLLPNLPLGTLAANLAGGYLVGIALGCVEQFDTLAPEVRFMLTTGFLGSLTTFSAFSSEATTLLLRHAYGWASAVIGAHVAGSLVMTLLGVATVALIRAWLGNG